MTYKNIIANSLIGFITLTAIGLTVWMLFLFHPGSTNVLQPASVPDAFMEGVTAVIMNAQGKPNMKIMAPKMVHYPENDTTDLIEPELTLYRKSPEPWHITAKYAKATHGIDLIHFWEDVTIHHQADQNNPATLIKTPTLTVFPHSQTAETKDIITLIQPNMMIRSVGMHADMNTGDVKLLSQARGEYVPSL